jgi:hypothetical protein
MEVYACSLFFHPHLNGSLAALVRKHATACCGAITVIPIIGSCAPPRPAPPRAGPQGADMYDSVYPTRTARFGVALVPEGVLKLKNSQFAMDFRWGREVFLGWPSLVQEWWA